MSIPVLFGPYGNPQLPDDVKDFGVNAVWFHGFNEQAFHSCDKLNIAACVEYKTFRADFNEHPELIPVGIDGKPIRYGELVQGICLSQHDYLKQIEEQLIEGIRRFQPRGIWLDYLTYAGWFETPNPDLQESCFCKNCIRDFCETAGVDASSPEEILQKYAREWHLHKCNKIAGYAARYADLIRKRLPDCIVGAYMCPWTPQEFDGALSNIFAQDYHLLASSIDVFTPLIYCKKSGRGSEWGKEWLEGCREFVPGNNKVQLILDYLEFPDSLLQSASSEVCSWGIQLFGGAQLFNDRDKAELFKKAVDSIAGSINTNEASIS